MRFVIEDQQGRHLGATELEGSRWEQVSNHFENVQPLVVELKDEGLCGDCYIQSGNERIEGPVAGITGHRFNAGDKVVFEAWKMRLSFHERHIGQEMLRAPSASNFTADLMKELRVRADRLRVLLPAIGRGEVSSAADDLIAAVDDLLALSG